MSRRFPGALILVFTLAGVGAACSTAANNNNALPEFENDFDLDTRIAEIDLNGGIHTTVSSASGDIFLEITDPAHPLFGAAISIPASAMIGLPRSLLSIEPYNGPALSLGIGQITTGTLLDTSLVSIDDGSPVLLAQPLATVFAPYSLLGFGSSFTESNVFLGVRISEFASELTSITGRGLHENPDRVSGLVSKFTIFVAYHDDFQVSPDEEDSGEDDIPDDPSAQTYLYNIHPEIGSNCIRSTFYSAAPLSRFLTYEIVDGSTVKSKFMFIAQDPISFVNILEYVIELSGTVIQLPQDGVSDPGFPSSLTAYSFTASCEDGSVTIQNFDDSVSEASELEANGVELNRGVAIGNWFTTSVDEFASCGGSPCEIHTGFVHVNISALRFDDYANPASNARFITNTWFKDAIWEVPK